MAASLYQVGFAGAVDQTPHFAQTCSGCLSSNTGDHSEDASSGDRKVSSLLHKVLVMSRIGRLFRVP